MVLYCFLAYNSLKSVLLIFHTQKGHLGGYYNGIWIFKGF